MQFDPNFLIVFGVSVVLAFFLGRLIRTRFIKNKKPERSEPKTRAERRRAQRQARKEQR